MRRLLIFVVFTVVAVGAQAQTVTRVGVVAKPQTYNGPCPATLHFVGTIHVSRYPVVVTYQWERSDGAIGPRQRVEIRSAGGGVTDTWQLGSRREHLRVWEQLHVVAPSNVRSPRAIARVNCR